MNLMVVLNSKTSTYCDGPSHTIPVWGIRYPDTYLRGYPGRYLQVVPRFVSDSLLYLGIFFGKLHAIEFNEVN